MPILHMETHLVRGVGKQLQQAANFLLDYTQQLGTSMQHLSSNWQGPSAEIFIADMQPITHLLNQLCDAGTVLSQRLHREVDEWERVDTELGRVIGVMTDVSSINTQVEKTNEFDNTPFVQGIGESAAIDPSDVTQGQLGDCYFMASMAALANNNPELIGKLIHDNGDGTYTVTFYEKKKLLGLFDQGYEKVEVTITEEFSNKYAQPGDIVKGKQEIWPMILEKAYANWKGGYKNIEGGRPHDALEVLTGVDSKDYKPGSLSLQDLTKHYENGDAIALSSLHDWKLFDKWDIPDSSDSNRLYQEDILVTNHAYYISSVDSTQGTVTIRNPWGWNHPEIVLTYDEFQDAFQKVTINPG